MPESPQPLPLTPEVAAGPDVLSVPETDAEPLASVLRTLRLERLGGDEYAGSSLPQLNERIYGGQVLAQAIVAAADTLVGDGDGDGVRQLHSVHGYFLRPGKLGLPITFAVERLHDGRSFSTRRTHALQQGKPILSLISSYQEDQPGREHGGSAPAAPDPESLTSAITLFDTIDHPVAKFMSSIAAFDIRHVDESVYVQAPQARSDEQMLWMRARSPLPAGTTQLLHRALLAYACDQVLLEPVLRRHGLHWRTPGLSVASLDHAMWWHRPVRVDDWLLFVQHSPSAQGGRGLGIAKVFDRSGAHVATVGQEGMVRVPDDDDRPVPTDDDGEWHRPALR
ncbi:acyl-CoA thioesterase [Georgenia yuyongxinii]|uniref:Acyl-CoA thioesterase II n=1 Tax=Georgenia yuyongxinii TaxID=2589797 RepID=A0A552WMA5_9MICO|nr:acyl-CoA thioesterase domain-containing protein [Georgenia yuyongxinii]TRW43872.1 acyl-CoA thioesterase II [Georgenia yuyongxinii]